MLGKVLSIIQVYSDRFINATSQPIQSTSAISSLQVNDSLASLLLTFCRVVGVSGCVLLYSSTKSVIVIPSFANNVLILFLISFVSVFIILYRLSLLVRIVTGSITTIIIYEELEKVKIQITRYSYIYNIYDEKEIKKLYKFMKKD